jgi:antitoxin ParD1/3/4
MNVQIPPDLNPFVEQMVSCGSYRNEEEVVIEGLRLLQNREQLRADVIAGIHQLEQGHGIDGNDVFSRLEARAKQLDQKAT